MDTSGNGAPERVVRSVRLHLPQRLIIKYI